MKQARVVLISGAGAGIGAAIARRAAQAGHRVAVSDLDHLSAQQVADELGAQGLALQLDVRDPHDWEAAFDEVERHWGPVDILVSNAGIIHTGNARDLSPEQHRDMLEVNYVGATTGILTALQRMRARGSGQIVTICSMTSYLPLSGFATYGATKHALRAFHHALALEERGGPVRFTIVHPPGTRTAMLEQEFADPSAFMAYAEKAIEPDEVARVVVATFGTSRREVVFPALGGRFQRLVGSHGGLMQVAMPVVERVARRTRAKAHRQRAQD